MMNEMVALILNTPLDSTRIHQLKLCMKWDAKNIDIQKKSPLVIQHGELGTKTIWNAGKTSSYKDNFYHQ